MQDAFLPGHSPQEFRQFLRVARSEASRPENYRQEIATPEYSLSAAYVTRQCCKIVLQFETFCIGNASTRNICIVTISTGKLLIGKLPIEESSVGRFSTGRQSIRKCCIRRFRNGKTSIEELCIEGLYSLQRDCLYQKILYQKLCTRSSV